ncbi:MAG: hypothetical protein H6719_05600 [Sandaracinaceae bacterium]|nr:hypothetical protein [Sandaracinaceae bacterium]
MRIASEQPIDWTALAVELGTLGERGERGGGQVACDALNALLGSEQLRLAVAHYLDLRPGFELVRSVLSLLRPPVAMHECYRVYRESDDIERRRAAVELLRVVADVTTLPWVEEFLDDPDEGIQAWGAGVLDCLVVRDLVDGREHTVRTLVARLESHASWSVRQCASVIRGMLEDRGP